MDENIVRALGAILSRRDKETLRGIFVGFAIARAFTQEKPAEEFFECGVIAADRELKLLPGHEDDEIETATAYAERLRDGAVEHLRIQELITTIRGVAKVFGPDAAIDLAKRSGAVVEVAPEGGGLPDELLKRLMEEKCSNCEKTECPATAPSASSPSAPSGTCGWC
jgi:hypothetical protein